MHLLFRIPRAGGNARWKGLPQGGQLFPTQDNLGRLYIFPHVIGVQRARNGKYIVTLRHQPGQRHLALGRQESRAQAAHMR